MTTEKRKRSNCTEDFKREKEMKPPRFRNRAALALLSTMLTMLISAVGCAQESAKMAITQLTDNVYRAQSGTHFTVFLVTPEGVILADPISKDFSQWLKSEIEQRFGVPVRYVLYSHHHWDHASGGDVFADTAAFVGQQNMVSRLILGTSDTPLPAEAASQDLDGDGIISSEEAKDSLQRNFDLYDADDNGELSGAEVTRGPIGDVRAPDVTYQESMSISLGGRTAEMTWTGPITHTDDMSVIRFPDEGVVFAVDFISIDTLPYRTLGTKLLPEWLDAIRDVEAMNFDIVAPGHGKVGRKEDVAKHRQYLQDLRDAVASAIRSGESLAQMQQAIQLTEYSDWSMYDTWKSENIEGMYRLLTDEK